jgi:radical SAM protein with 4Fe4S-binding SPASM domain
MKADFKVSAQQESSERLCLKEVLPLDTPLSLQIELASACNFKCSFCMHGNDELIKSKVLKIGIMKYDLFIKIVNDIKKFPKKIKFISLQCRGESLLNPQLPQMIDYLKKADVAEQIVLNTNASLLNEELSLAIIEAGLDFIRFSIEAVSTEGYKRIAGVNIDFEKLVEKIAFFYAHKKQCNVYSKILDCGMSKEEKVKFVTTFENISDRIFIEYPVNLWKDAGLDEEQFKTNRWSQKVFKTEICPRIFFAYAVHFDGTVVGCDSDWKAESPLGDANKDNLVSIWSGRKFNEMRCLHLSKNTQMYSRCQDCFVYQECLEKDCLDGDELRLHELYK